MTVALWVAAQFIDGLENCQTIGRNGLHRYNNQDHSMLTAMVAAWGMREGIVSGAGRQPFDAAEAVAELVVGQAQRRLGLDPELAPDVHDDQQRLGGEELKSAEALEVLAFEID